MDDWDIIQDRLINSVTRCHYFDSEDMDNYIEDIQASLKFVKNEYKTFNPRIIESYMAFERDFTNISKQMKTDTQLRADYVNLYGLMMNQIRCWSMTTRYL